MRGRSTDGSVPVSVTSSLTSNETTLAGLGLGVATTLELVTADRQAEHASESGDSTPDTGSTAPENSVLYSERLWVPIWWWGAGAAVAVLLAAEIHMGAPGIRAWLPYVLLLPLIAWALFAFSRLRVEVVAGATGAELRVGSAHLPLDVASKAAVVPGTAKSAALGRQLDPLAFVQHRTWVKQMVIVVLDDPDDPTPYWLVSSRRPAELARIVNSVVG